MKHFKPQRIVVHPADLFAIPKEWHDVTEVDEAAEQGTALAFMEPPKLREVTIDFKFEFKTEGSK